jgi:hypothetical protein
MEKNTLMNLSVRHSQLASFALFNLSGLTAIILILLGLAGVLTANDIPQWVGYFNETFFAMCSLVAYLMLSRIAANLPTSKGMKYVGVFLFIVALLSVAFRYYRTHYELSTLEFSGFNALFFLLKTAPILYLFGAIVRNNPDCRKAKLSIHAMYAVAFIGQYIVASLVIPALQWWAGLEIIDMVSGIAWIAGSYVLFTSDAFSGQADSSPTQKGAYRFWNKYMTWYIITMLGSTFLLIFLESCQIVG